MQISPDQINALLLADVFENVEANASKVLFCVFQYLTRISMDCSIENDKTPTGIFNKYYAKANNKYMKENVNKKAKDSS